jgi:hypothetical protein
MNKILYLILLILLISCDNKRKNIVLTKVSTEESEYDFGKANLNDTINYTFKIKNITKNNLIISNIATSCGCTQVGKTKRNLKFNEEANINIQFIPNENQIGTMVKNSVIVETNTEPPFTVFNIKGKVQK